MRFPLSHLSTCFYHCKVYRGVIFAAGKIHGGLKYLLDVLLQFSETTLQMLTARSLAARMRSEGLGGNSLPNLAREHVSQIRMVKAASMKLYALANLQRRSVPSPEQHSSEPIRSYLVGRRVSQPLDNGIGAGINDNLVQQENQPPEEQQATSANTPVSFLYP